MKGICIIGAISHNFKKELYVHCTKHKHKVWWGIWTLKTGFIDQASKMNSDWYIDKNNIKNVGMICFYVFISSSRQTVFLMMKEKWNMYQYKPIYWKTNINSKLVAGIIPF